MNDEGTGGDQSRCLGVCATEPFLLGAPSWMVPAGYGENLNLLAPLVRDVELLFLEDPRCATLPSEEERASWLALAGEKGLGYTVHLPVGMNLGSSDDTRRRQGLSACRTVLDWTLPLDPRAWILHLEPWPGPGRDGAWCRRCRDSVHGLLDAGIVPRKLALESLNYPLDVLEPILLGEDVSCCLDVGHCLRWHLPLWHQLEQWLDRIRVIHLHGCVGERDHLPLTHLTPGLLADLLGLLRKKGWDGVLTLEVFGLQGLLESLDVLGGKR